MSSERWRPLPGFAEFYEVSDAGMIRSKTRVTRGGQGARVCRGRVLVLHPDRDGYLLAHLNVRGTGYMVKAHRAVALAFIPPAAGKPEVNHLNGVKTDNRVANLEWASRRDNNRHAVLTLGHTSLLNTLGR
jgi:hypothetical protein